MHELTNHCNNQIQNPALNRFFYCSASEISFDELLYGGVRVNDAEAVFPLFAKDDTLILPLCSKAVESHIGFLSTVVPFEALVAPSRREGAVRFDVKKQVLTRQEWGWPQRVCATIFNPSLVEPIEIRRGQQMAEIRVYHPHALEWEARVGGLGWRCDEHRVVPLECFSCFGQRTCFRTVLMQQDEEMGGE